MAKAPPEAACDVRISFEEWRRIKDKPLFFLAPEQVHAVLGAGLSVEAVYKSASGKTKAPLGRDAIRRVLDLYPSVLSKVKDIKAVINSIYPRAFGDEHVIAAVFALPKLNDDLKRLRVSDAELATAIEYRREAVAAARDNYRVTLDFADRTVKFLNTRVEEPITLASYATVIGGDRRFIKNLGTADSSDYVFGAEDLRIAPESGHPWARSS